MKPTKLKNKNLRNEKLCGLWVTKVNILLNEDKVTCYRFS